MLEDSTDTLNDRRTVMSERTKAEERQARKRSRRQAPRVQRINAGSHGTYDDPDVWSLPNNPKRWRYVLDPTD
jgi:hypothetical protein